MSGWSMVMMSKRIGVLMGGASKERDISMRSGQAMLKALKRENLDVVGIELGHDLTRDAWPEQLHQAGIEVAVIALHGVLGEDGAVQGMLEILAIPYTGSGHIASALCMEKNLCKAILNQAGLKTAVSIPITSEGPIRYPVIVKPVIEGSSIGLKRLQNVCEWYGMAIDDVSIWMAEMPLRGVEVAVSVLDGEALPPIEVVPLSGLYDFAAKYQIGLTEYHCPARIPPETLRRCMQVAEDAVHATGCYGAPRVDMIIEDGGEPVILEINTIPGMTETSLLPKAAEVAGISFDQLCLQMLASASLHGVGAKK
ncbi:MAG: D-alanine--D-alanine ligase [Mariprofundaceae bacterium]